MVTNKKNMKPRQYAALKGSINLGRTLQKEHPEIVNLFRGGLSDRKISQRLDIPQNYNVSYRVAMSAIRYSIVGYDGKYCNAGESYSGFMEISERENLTHEHRIESSHLIGLVVGKMLVDEKKGIHGRTSKEHSTDGIKGGNKTLEMKVGIHGQTSAERIASGKKGGKIAYTSGKGIHGRSEEERQIDRLKGGKTSGKKHYENGTGMFSRTPEKVREDSIKATLARGEIPWSDEEKEYLYRLSQNPNYFHPENTSWKGKPDIIKIRKEINTKFHEGKDLRTADTIRMNLTKIRKNKKIID